MSKEKHGDKIAKFYKAVYPAMTELAMASNNEETVLTDATELINNQRKTIDCLAAENEKLKRLNSEVVCVYCGEKVKRTTPEETADRILGHICVCEKNPFIRQIADLEKALEGRRYRNSLS